MNEYAKKLVAALRSGKYEQGWGQLRREDKFCCLGVACDLIQDELGVTWSGSAYFGPGYSFLKHVSELPAEVRQLYGFRTDTGWFWTKDGIEISLAALNDNGKSFNEIADFIESEPEGLFE